MVDRTNIFEEKPYISSRFFLIKLLPYIYQCSISLSSPSSHFPPPLLSIQQGNPINRHKSKHLFSPWSYWHCSERQSMQGASCSHRTKLPLVSSSTSPQSSAVSPWWLTHNLDQSKHDNEISCTVCTPGATGRSWGTITYSSCSAGRTTTYWRRRCLIACHVHFPNFLTHS